VQGEKINDLFVSVAEAAAAKLPPVSLTSAVSDDPAVRRAVQVGGAGGAGGKESKPGDQCGCS